MGDDFILEYVCESKNEWKVFRKSILFHLGSISGFLYFLIQKEILGLYLGVGFLLFTIPQLLLHIQYKLKDRNKKIIVNHSKQTIRVERLGKLEKQFEFKDIAEIIRHKGQKYENNMTYALPSFFYNYTEIVLKNGQQLVYSDFISKTIGLKNIEIKEKQSLFNIVVKQEKNES